MWIAKPIDALKDEERLCWSSLEARLPLSQTLRWASAIQAVSGRSYLVFSPDEQVGGIVFSPSPQRGYQFECINGPWLHWDNPEKISRQFATFAMAVSKLEPKFTSLSIKPRWEAEAAEKRSGMLPIPAFQTTQASTLVIPIRNNSQDQFSSLSHRMKRTLSASWKAGIRTQVTQVTPEILQDFVPTLTAFAQNHHFSVPPLNWFEALIRPHKPSHSDLQFWLVVAELSHSPFEKSFAQILIGQQGRKASYLFGCEIRSNTLRSAISLAAVAQWEAMNHCISLKLEHYDLNGYVVDATSGHPYYGVCKFKEQFSGKLVRYFIPEFLIQ